MYDIETDEEHEFKWKVLTEPFMQEKYPKCHRLLDFFSRLRSNGVAFGLESIFSLAWNHHNKVRSVMTT